ncbi:MAG: lipase family protein [Candidatus Aminicenantes bacterium]|nr:lipase family protein [Candidatus Aminicenantes bacterium]
MFKIIVQRIKAKIATRNARMDFPVNFKGCDLRVALYLAKLAEWAYPFGVAVSIDYKTQEDFLEDMERKRKTASAWGFKNFQYAYSEDMKILAFILRKRRDVIVCFRGTVLDNTLNLETDIRARLIPMASFGSVHKGFSSALDSVWPEIRTRIQPGKKQRLWVTGHSMGGALALLAGARFVNEYKGSHGVMINGLYVFGAPRVGDGDFADAFNNTYLGRRCFLFAKYNDIVTVLPPCIKKIWEYRDVGNIVYIDREGALKFIECLSDLKTLRYFLSGYFSEHLLGGFNKGKISHDWQTFKQYFTRFFSELKPVVSTPREESENWSRFKNFFTKELPDIEPGPNYEAPGIAPRNIPGTQLEQDTENGDNSGDNSDGENNGQRRLLRMIGDLFLELFLEFNPYVIDSHDIESYIEHLKNWGKQKKNITFADESYPPM